MLSQPTADEPVYYADAAVIAYRLPAAEKPVASLNPKITSSGGTFSLAELTDGDLASAKVLPPMEVGQDGWIQYEFDSPQTIKAFNLVGAAPAGELAEFRGMPDNRMLKVSDDGTTFRMSSSSGAARCPKARWPSRPRRPATSGLHLKPRSPKAIHLPP
jgi:hypothetical protein